MSNHTDCLFVGHNEGDFETYEARLRKMGERSPEYRELRLNFISVDGQPKTLGSIWNSARDYIPSHTLPLSFFDTFSATISYLGTFLNRRGLTFDYVHSFWDERDRLAQLLESGNMRVVAVTTTYYVEPEPLVQVVKWIREHNNGATIVVGGPFVTTQVRSLQDSATISYLFESIGADVYVNSSQGEAALTRIIKASQVQDSLADIPNLFIRSGNMFKPTSCDPERNPLSENNVNWTLFADRINEYVNVRTAISCPFSCAFCSFPEHAGSYETTPVEVLARELNKLTSVNQLKGVKFVDDTFNVPLDRFRQILKMLLKQRTTFRWFANFRCQYADRTTVAMMRDSGCAAVFLGLESGSDTVLQAMNKHATARQYMEGIALLRDAGILTFGSMIIGHPGETDQTVHETIDFLRNSGLDFFRPNLWYCERITPIWRNRSAFDLEGENFQWRHATMNSQQACNWVEEVIQRVDSPTFVPMYDFDIESIWHLQEQGYSIDQIRSMLELFRNVLRRQLLGYSRNLASSKLLPTAAACFADQKLAQHQQTALASPQYAAFRFDA